MSPELLTSASSCDRDHALAVQWGGDWQNRGKNTDIVIYPQGRYKYNVLLAKIPLGFVWERKGIFITKDFQKIFYINLVYVQLYVPEYICVYHVHAGAHGA